MAIKNQPDLMLWVMRKFSTYYGARAVLRGGVALSLLSSPRHTNDIDYLLLQYKSKKSPVSEICTLLDELPELKYSYQLNSKNLRFLLNYNKIKIQVEIQVEEDCDSVPIATSNLTSKAGQTGFIVNIVSLESALASKIAA